MSHSSENEDPSANPAQPAEPSDSAQPQYDAAVRRGPVRLRTHDGWTTFEDAIELVALGDFSGPSGGTSFALQFDQHVFGFMSGTEMLHLVGETPEGVAIVRGVILAPVVKIYEPDGSGALVLPEDLRESVTYPAVTEHGVLVRTLQIMDLEFGNQRIQGVIGVVDLDGMTLRVPGVSL